MNGYAEITTARTVFEDQVGPLEPATIHDLLLAVRNHNYAGLRTATWDMKTGELIDAHRLFPGGTVGRIEHRPDAPVIDQVAVTSVVHANWKLPYIADLAEPVWPMPSGSRVGRTGCGNPWARTLHDGDRSYRVASIDAARLRLPAKATVAFLPMVTARGRLVADPTDIDWSGGAPDPSRSGP